MWNNYILKAIAASAPLLAIATTGAVILIIGASGFSSNQAHTVSDINQNSTLARVWDQQREDYSGNMKMTVYRSPSCGCCHQWMDHAKKQGFEITEVKTDNMDAIKKQYKIPANIASCHTAIIDGYVMEGHIPATDIKRFLKQKPNQLGLIVPGMSIGSPGMESGNNKQPFEVLTLGKNGSTQVFKTYQNY
jgi:hypothetical protein